MNRRTLLIAALVVGALVTGALAWYFLRSPALIAEEDWQLDLGRAAAPERDIPPELQSLVDKLASSESMEAGKAWMEIGARYRSSDQFLSELGPALWDTRPVSIRFVKETFSGGGSTFTYFTVKSDSSKGAPAYVHSVGQALAYHLWQYEDVSNSGFKGTFKKWWYAYAPSHGIPPPRDGP